MAGRTRGQIAGYKRKREGFDKDGSGGRRHIEADTIYRTTTTTGTVGGRYSVTMETVAAGRDAVEMQGDKGRQKTAKGGRNNRMTEW